MSGLPEIRSEYSPTYKRINVGGLFGSIRPSGLETFVYSEEPVIDKVLTTEPISPHRSMIKRTVECELIIDPMQMKSIQQWLNQKIAEYERLFGQIPSPEEVESRAKRGPANI
jgi:hypothetical protein